MSRPNTGHPYGRLSSNPQTKGHGETRQKVADFQGFCDEFGFTLSEKTRFDKGVSGYDGSNWDEDAELGKFVREAQRGIKVRRGDCLIVEDWDRLAKLPWTRLMIRVGELFEAGIHLGDATRMRLIRYDSEEVGDAIDLICGTSRGHASSKRTSGMVQKEKDQRRQQAANGEAILTRSLPPWIRIVPCADDDKSARWYGPKNNRQRGKLALREPQASTVREIFALRREGLGAQRIVREMMRRGEPNPSGHRWRAEKVSALICDRRVIGELPPARFKAAKKRKGQGKAEHPAVPGYYPAIIKEADFYAVQSGRRGGPGRRGRDSDLPNPFRGMIRDALSGETYYVIWKPQRDGTKLPKLINDDGINGGGRLRSFDYTAFEDAICSKLYEINPADIVGESDAGRDAAALAGQLADCEQRRAAFKASTRGKVITPLLADEAIALDEEYEQLKEELSEAQARAEHPLSEAWGEQQSLLAAMKNAADPVAVRLRLRERLRQTVRQLWLLVVPVGRERMAAVQIDFQGGDQRRHYMFTYSQAVKTPAYSRPASCEPVLSWRSDGSWRGIDLASREEAAALAKVLASGVELAKFTTSHSASR